MAVMMQREDGGGKEQRQVKLESGLEEREKWGQAAEEAALRLEEVYRTFLRLFVSWLVLRFFLASSFLNAV